MNPMWKEHWALALVVIAVGRWIVGHVRDIKAKLNGYTVTVHKTDPDREEDGETSGPRYDQRGDREPAGYDPRGGQELPAQRVRQNGDVDETGTGAMGHKGRT